MKQIKWFTALALVASVIAVSAVRAGDLYTTNASGSTSASVAFPSRPAGFSLVNVDVTSDKAASVLSWRYGTTHDTAAVAAAAGATNVVVFTSTLASNDVVLLQNASGVITQKTVYGRTQSTNYVVNLDNVLGTNIAVGDTFSRALTNKYTVQFDVTATNATALIVDTTNALVNGSPIYTAPGNVVLKSIATNITQVSAFSLPVNPLPGAAAVNDLVWLRQTNRTSFAGTNAENGTSLHVATTNGFAANDRILIASATGHHAVRLISSVGLTNITVSVAPGFAIAVGDEINLVNSGTTNLTPASVGQRTLTVGATNSLVNGSILVVVPSTGEPWQTRVTGTATATSVKTINLMSATLRKLPAGTSFYLLTNTYTAFTAQAGTAFTMTVTSTNGLTPGTAIVISPATGGNFLNIYRGTLPQVFNTIAFTATIGAAISAGDGVYGTTVTTTPVGAATLRLNGDNLRWAPPISPAVLSIDGTSACSINSATIK